MIETRAARQVLVALFHPLPPSSGSGSVQLQWHGAEELGHQLRRYGRVVSRRSDSEEHLMMVEDKFCSVA
jgi:hypothetical protein